MNPDAKHNPIKDVLLALITSRVISSLLSFVLAIGVATLLITIAGFDVSKGYQAMLKGAFGSPVSIADVFARATPLIFTGLAVAVALRASLFNVGVEGQMLIGAMAASQVGLIQGLPASIHVPLAFLSAAIVGGLWGMVPAFLKARFRAHEVITTIMLNYVVILFTGYLANYPLHAQGEMLPATIKVAVSAQLPRLIKGGQLTIAFFIAVVSAIVLKLLIDRSVLGYEIRAVGLNPKAAEAKGISQTKCWLYAMAISGAMAGFAGAGEVLGIHRRFIEGFSPGYGFDGIAVALMGYNDPLGSVIAGLILGMIRTGALVMDRTTRIPVDFVIVIQGLMLVFLAVPGLLDFLRERKKNIDQAAS
ncbi:MAG: ABC transporter permease [Anaerolineales bacterium]|nr:ABC transporter permease [Anaerolineales bacterium]